MGARTFMARLSAQEQKQLESHIEHRARMIAAIAVEQATQNIFLQTLYLHFERDGYRRKRLKRLCNDLMEQKKELDKLYEEQSMVAVMIERMKSCGADFTPTFKELLENEEERFRKKKEQEQAIRAKMAQLTPEQRKALEGWK